MRIAVVTQEDPFYLPPALDAFCRARRTDVVALIILPAFNERLTATASRLYAFYGPRDFTRLAMRYAWAIIANRLNGLRPLTRPYSAHDVARLGCINLHSAPLPRYQGMMPNFWTMVEGEPEAAVTVHYMVEKLDAGDIILQRAVPIRPPDSLHDLMVRSKVVGVEALLEAV